MTPFKLHLFDVYVGNTHRKVQFLAPCGVSACRSIRLIVVPLVIQCKCQFINMHIKPFNYREYHTGTSCSLVKQISAIIFAWSNLDTIAIIFLEKKNLFLDKWPFLNTPNQRERNISF